VTLHPEDVRYWSGWIIVALVAFALARLWLVNPILRAIDRIR
jgi:hypothetical protein